MEALLLGLGETALAEWVRLSRWGYAAINTLHVLGIALLVGAILPMDLRLLGCRRSPARADVVRLLRPWAMTGLALAVITGALLFLADPAGYLATPLFFFKLGLIALGIVSALVVTLTAVIEGLSRGQRLAAAGLSLLVWPSVLVAGRMLAYVGG